MGLTLYYMIRNDAWLRALFGVTAPVDLWWGISPVSVGAFGVPVGFAACALISLLTAPPSAEVRAFVRSLRHPL